MEVHTKALYDNLEKAVNIIEEVLTKTKFDDYKRLKEILEETKSRLNKSIIQSGNVASRMRTMSYYGSESYIRELLSGIAFYKFVEELLDDFDNKKEEIEKKISDTVKYVFRKDNITINYAGNKESFEKVKALVSNLQQKMNEPVDFKESFDGWTFEKNEKNEGFTTSGQVQYVARCGNYKDSTDEQFDGSMQVLSSIMSSEYLWNNIRVLGGAYGCGLSLIHI